LGIDRQILAIARAPRKPAFIDQNHDGCLIERSIVGIGLLHIHQLVLIERAGGRERHEAAGTLSREAVNLRKLVRVKEDAAVEISVDIVPEAHALITTERKQAAILFKDGGSFSMNQRKKVV
jgi:hypothetical protein